MRVDCVNDNQMKFLTDFIGLMKRYNIPNVVRNNPLIKVMSINVK